MITAIVLYRLPPTIGRDACARHFKKITENFTNVPGLLRKQFIWTESGDAGGVYTWRDLESARAFYSGPWLDGILQRYGCYPKITYFDTFAITDNSAGSITLLETNKTEPPEKTKPSDQKVTRFESISA
ncbi:MAG: hypothetical protein KJZ80_15040 [Hyphomicrobiaceae bacterium]|nr:hypothetical protein [Hyphomicrobiaceae bacterium]